MAGTKSLSLNGKVLPLPRENPNRILMVSDTGCRIKDPELQACNDSNAWVFAKLASVAAALKPDLILHAGDYVSREGPCPARFTGCSGSPFGDNWATWQTDFFAPAAPLLEAAPIVLTRGNHEDCNREGLGWLRLMGADRFDPATPCVPHTPLVTLQLGGLTLAIADTASAPETALLGDRARDYALDLRSLADAPSPVWLLQHRPVWGAIAGPLGIPIGGNLTLIEAIKSTPIPPNVELMLSGHIHGFEAMNYYDDLPPQIIAGNGGDLGHDIPRLLKGAIFQGWSGAAVKDGVSDIGFGFLMLTRMPEGWSIQTYDSDGNAKRQCLFKDRRIDCAN